MEGTLKVTSFPMTLLWARNLPLDQDAPSHPAWPRTLPGIKGLFWVQPEMLKAVTSSKVTDWLCLFHGDCPLQSLGVVPCANEMCVQIDQIGEGEVVDSSKFER